MSETWEKELPNGTVITFTTYESPFSGYIYCLQTGESFAVKFHSSALTRSEAEALFAQHLVELASRVLQKKQQSDSGCSKIRFPSSATLPSSPEKPHDRRTQGKPQASHRHRRQQLRGT